MAVVMIGVDPHKASRTAVAINAAEERLGQLRVRASAVQAERLLGWARAWPERAWAVEGAGRGGASAGPAAAVQRVSGCWTCRPSWPPGCGCWPPGTSTRTIPAMPARWRSPACARRRSGRPGVMIMPRCSRSGPERYRDLGRARTQVPCRLHQVLCELVPGGVPGEITAGRAGQVLASITPAEAVEAARWELAADLTEDLRGIDARIRETRKKAAAAVAAAGTCLTGLSGASPVIAAAVIGDVRHVSRFPGRDRFAACNGTAPIEVSSGGRKGLPAVPARQPPARPRDPHGRGHPDPLPAHQGPRLLRQEAGRRQNRERSAARAQTPDQRRHLRLPAGRRPARRPQPGARQGNRGTTLPPGRPARTPTTGSSGQPLPGLPPTLRPLLLLLPRRCHLVRASSRVQDRAQPGRAAAPAGRPRPGRPRADNPRSGKARRTRRTAAAHPKPLPHRRQRSPP